MAITTITPTIALASSPQPSSLSEKIENEMAASMAIAMTADMIRAMFSDPMGSFLIDLRM